MPTEKQLDLLLEERLRSDESFWTWFLSKTFKGASYTRLVLLRANHPWSKVRAILPNQVTGALEAGVLEAETDVLAVLEDRDGRRMALHIENKLARGKLRKYQPEMYAARADTWRKNEHYGNYDEWETVLIAPLSFKARNEPGVRKFTSFISHEDIAAQLPEFIVTTITSPVQPSRPTTL